VSNIVLTGFMGTGKTAVGRLLAKRLGLRFVECDALVEERTGRTIADLFSCEGEPTFRALERSLIAEVTSRPGQVIATGGGAVKDSENLRHMKSAGPVVCLTARPQVIWQRVMKVKHRPLLRVRDPRRRIEELLAERAPFYAQVHFSVDTSDISPAQVVRRITDALGHVRVELGERAYDIAIGRELLDEVGPGARRLIRPHMAAVITHPALARLYGEQVRASLDKAGIRAAILAVPPGERSKSFAQAQRLHALLLESGADRASAIIALGGGVIGDLAGFVAATYMRGIPFIQVPTTLLAQVDASVGGKVAVNHPRAKNLVGCFYQPCAVIADLETLRTLPRRQLRSGMAEVVKHAVIRDAALFEYLERFREQVLALEPVALQHVVRRNCEIKAQVVAADERETGLREILNFGHTVGHALESALGYRMLHGEALSVGMVAAARLSAAMGVLPKAQAARIEALLGAIGLPVRARRTAVDAVARHMAADKKARAGMLRFVLLKEIGEATASMAVKPALARHVFQSVLS
jgi:3-dehydroquinate synthase